MNAAAILCLVTVALILGGCFPFRTSVHPGDRVLVQFYATTPLLEAQVIAISPGGEKLKIRTAENVTVWIDNRAGYVTPLDR